MDSQPAHIRPPNCSDAQIISASKRLFDRYCDQSDLPIEIFTISFDALYEQIIYPDFQIELVEDEDLGCDEEGKKYLGRFDVESNTAFVDVSLARNDPRRTFTCYHEVVGHALLQGKWLRKEMKRLNSKLRIHSTEESLDLRTVNILERQANLCASHIAAPKALLLYAINDVLTLNRRIIYRGPGFYTFSIRGVSQRYFIESFNDLCRVIARNVRFRFGGLSIEALSYRIEQMPIFDIQTNPSPKLHLHRVASATAMYAASV